jgi:hypothetical protein
MAISTSDQSTDAGFQLDATGVELAGMLNSINGPTLKTDLSVNDFKITSTEGGKVVIEPDDEAVVYNLRAPGSNRKTISTPYAVIAEDDGAVLYSASGSAVAVSIPTGLPIDTHFMVWQDGAGIITITPGAGETIGGDASFDTLGAGRMAYICKTSSANWSVSS